MNVESSAKVDVGNDIVQSITSRIGDRIQQGSNVLLPQDEEAAAELTQEELQKLAEEKEAKRITEARATLALLRAIPIAMKE